MSEFEGKAEDFYSYGVLITATDAVEKVPKYIAANFQLKDKTSDDRRSTGLQLYCGSHR